MAKDKVFGFQRGPRSEQPIRAHQINLQKSLIDRTINRFANISQLFGFAVGTPVAFNRHLQLSWN
jgi:hypothetical protein